jgi:radical SAM protein (TIGR04043 family)
MQRSLPMVAPRSLTAPPRPWPELISELQALGLRWLDPDGPGLSRAGGAGPSDHKALTIAGHTVMVPIFTHASERSPFAARVSPSGASATLLLHGAALGEISFPKKPRFYEGSTADGIPYWKIATLHGNDVLATTILQTCIRYGKRASSCQFCAIGQSLAAKTTVPEKTPAMLAEVARAAVELDGVRQLVMTTGTPKSDDRGARVLSECARAVRETLDLPIQAQCEPPADFGWFARMKHAGVDTLGMHLEAVTEEVRRAIMPGKAEVSLPLYFEAFEAAVAVFGRGQVSTYILAGLGDSREAILETATLLVSLGVYPFVVPFVPIHGTLLEHHPTPSPAFMESVLGELSRMVSRAGLSSQGMKAGCGRCGACSSLRARESAHA